MPVERLEGAVVADVDVQGAAAVDQSRSVVGRNVDRPGRVGLSWMSAVMPFECMAVSNSRCEGGVAVADETLQYLVEIDGKQKRILASPKTARADRHKIKQIRQRPAEKLPVKNEQVTETWTSLMDLEGRSHSLYAVSQSDTRQGFSICTASVRCLNRRGRQYGEGRAFAGLPAGCSRPHRLWSCRGILDVDPSAIRSITSSPGRRSR